MANNLQEKSALKPERSPSHFFPLQQEAACAPEVLGLGTREYGKKQSFWRLFSKRDFSQANEEPVT